MIKTAEEILKESIFAGNPEHLPQFTEDHWIGWQEQRPEEKVKDAVNNAVDKAVVSGKKTNMIMFNWKDILTIIERVKMSSRGSLKIFKYL